MTAFFLASALGVSIALHVLALASAAVSPMNGLLQFLLRHGYPLVFFWVLLEQAGLPIPSAPLLFVAGALTGRGNLQFGTTLGLVVSAVLISDVTWFLLGRWRGAKVLRFVCRISLEPDNCVRRTREAVTRHGWLAVLASKFVPGLNAAMPPLSGTSGMSLPQFLSLDALSAILWAAAFTGLGRLFSRQLDQLALYARGFGGGLLALGLLLLGIYIARKYRARHRLLRAIGTERIPIRELRRLMEEGEPLTIVDLRHRHDFEHQPFVIPGALHCEPAEAEVSLGDVPPEREIVLYCT